MSEPTETAGTSGPPVVVVAADEMLSEREAALVDENLALRAEVERLKAAIENGVRDGTLDCVVRGKAPECPELGIRRPEQMCAPCRIRVTAQVRRQRRKEGER